MHLGSNCRHPHSKIAFSFALNQFLGESYDWMILTAVSRLFPYRRVLLSFKSCIGMRFTMVQMKLYEVS